MLDLPLSRVPFVFLDTETTGLNPDYGDRVVEIALARFTGGVMENFYTSLVNPGRRISPGAARIHGITDELVRDAPPFRDIAAKVSGELADAVIVAHNAPFDLGFVQNEYRLARLECPTNLVLDTLQFLRRHFRFQSNSLQNIAAVLGIQRDAAHRALADVLTTHAVFDFIIQDFARTRSLRTLGDLVALQGGPVVWGGRTPRQDFPLPPELEEALHSQRRLFLRYLSEDGSLTERWVSPVDVSARQEYIYLRAYCHLRAAERHFRLDRVIEMRIED